VKPILPSLRKTDAFHIFITNSFRSVRILLLLPALLYIAWPCQAQIPDDPETGTQSAPRAQPADIPVSAPAAAQDAEASREKLLKAADQIDLIESNAETSKVALDGMKADIAQLQADNTDLKQQIADLKTTIDKMEADRAKERQVLIDQVAQLIAASKRPHGVALAETASHPHASDSDTASGDGSASEVHHAAEDSPDTSAAPSGDLAPPADPAPAPKPQKGYYHTVESGETLTMICAAYRDQGVKVTVSQVRKANGLSPESVLRIGQKLFIPKPGD
jgi:LysM repeat protein